ncbi:MAG: hypothetical protein ABJA94_09590 [Rhodoglobus sp.]
MGIFSRTPKPEPINESIDEIMAREAARFAEVLPAGDAPASALDFTRSSLDVVDDVLGGFYVKGIALSPEQHFVASAYVFEVARREFGGRYLRGAGANPFVLVIGEPEFEVGVMVMAKIVGRTVNGPEDNILFFYDGIAPLVEKKKSATLV